MLKGKKIHMQWFANNIEIIVENEEDLQRILEIMEEMMLNEYKRKNKCGKDLSFCV